MERSEGRQPEGPKRSGARSSPTPRPRGARGWQSSAQKGAGKGARPEEESGVVAASAPLRC